MALKFKAPHEGRLDTLIVDECAKDPRFGTVTRSQLKRIIERGAVAVDGKVVAKAGTLVRTDAQVEVKELCEPSQPIEPHPRDLVVLHEDEELLVIDKPAGVVVHPGAGNRSATLVNALVARNRDFMHPFDPQSARPGIVHRLDKDTSGVIVVAKNPSVHHALARQFAARETKKHYRALVLSTPRGGQLFRQGETRGSFCGAIGRDPKHRRRMAVLPSGGKEARTHWLLLERMEHAGLLDVELETGRTHQIRVHCAAAGAPLIGDPVYGTDHVLPEPLQRESKRFGRQALHAFSLEFTHPRSAERMRFEAPLPADFIQLIQCFRGQGR
ncbi:MAG: RluA family pseudouridine synthase [Bdellovibrionota bacterium]|nr:MAG: RluA family pseudouridine synthase [Bdellovibrionota bacterium]